MNKTDIYFNAKKHVYTNEAGIPYISATTLIGKYEEKFDEKKFQIARACAAIGKKPRHPKYLKYKGMSAKAILVSWDKARDEGCDRGNKEHDWLETGIKESTGFYNIFKSRYDKKDDRVLLYTIEDVINNPDSGFMELGTFIDYGIKDKYPAIYKIIESFVKTGWHIYSEVGVFNNTYMVSGLIDILLVRGDRFIILDWKTNKAQVMFEAGYWEKDNNGIITNYKTNDTVFKYPLHNMPYSVGNKYTMQLSLYDWLVIQFGLKLVVNILAHIRHDNYEVDHKHLKDNPTWNDKTQVDIIDIKYMENNINLMLVDSEATRTNFQRTIFN